jgi:hypothetical protein
VMIRSKWVLGHSWIRSLRSDNVVTCRTFGPHTLGTIIFLVFDQKPRLSDTLATVRAPTESLRVVVHGKGEWKERVTSSFRMGVGYC